MLRSFLGPLSSSPERVKQFRMFGHSGSERLLFGVDAGRYLFSRVSLGERAFCFLCPSWTTGRMRHGGGHAAARFYQLVQFRKASAECQ
eukprot:10909025-Alexandrium_andersonii.AAC.1